MLVLWVYPLRRTRNHFKSTKATITAGSTATSTYLCLVLSVGAQDDKEADAELLNNGLLMMHWTSCEKSDSLVIYISDGPKPA